MSVEAAFHTWLLDSPSPVSRRSGIMSIEDLRAASEITRVSRRP